MVMAALVELVAKAVLVALVVWALETPALVALVAMVAMVDSVVQAAWAGTPRMV